MQMLTLKFRWQSKSVGGRVISAAKTETSVIAIIVLCRRISKEEIHDLGYFLTPWGQITQVHL